MSLRTIETKMGVKMETFEPTLWLIVKKGDQPILAKSFTMGLVTSNDIGDHVDATIKFISNMLVEDGEPPLSKEEIFYYKLTKEN